MSNKVYEIDFMIKRTEKALLENSLVSSVTVHYYLQENTTEILNGFLKSTSLAKLTNAIHLLGYLKVSILFTERK